jgi:hypothetical protein
VRDTLILISILFVPTFVHAANFIFREVIYGLGIEVQLLPALVSVPRR